MKKHLTSIITSLAVILIGAISSIIYAKLNTVEANSSNIRVTNERISSIKEDIAEIKENVLYLVRQSKK